MIDTEDSVVTSLNELRKLKNARKSRKGKKHGGPSHHKAAPMPDPSADMVTPPPVQPMSTVAARPVQAPVAAPAPAPAFVMPQQPIHAPAFDHMAAQSLVKQKSSATPAIIVALLLIGAGAAGYFKLQTDTKALIDAKNVEIRDAEEARNKAVEANARLEQQAKTNLAKCEDKLKLASATPAAAAPAIAPSVAPEPAPAAPSVASSHSSSSKASSSSRHASSSRSSSSSRKVAAATAPAEPAAAKPGAVPTIAKKKTLQDDPLAGLGK